MRLRLIGWRFALRIAGHCNDEPGAQNQRRLAADEHGLDADKNRNEIDLKPVREGDDNLCTLVRS